MIVNKKTDVRNKFVGWRGRKETTTIFVGWNNLGRNNVSRHYYHYRWLSTIWPEIEDLRLESSISSSITQSAGVVADKLSTLVCLNDKASRCELSIVGGIVRRLFHQTSWLGMRVRQHHPTKLFSKKTTTLSLLQRLKLAIFNTRRPVQVSWFQGRLQPPNGMRYYYATNWLLRPNFHPSVSNTSRRKENKLCQSMRSAKSVAGTAVATSSTPSSTPSSLLRECFDIFKRNTPPSRLPNFEWVSPLAVYDILGWKIPKEKEKKKVKGKPVFRLG